MKVLHGVIAAVVLVIGMSAAADDDANVHAEVKSYALPDAIRSGLVRQSCAFAIGKVYKAHAINATDPQMRSAIEACKQNLEPDYAKAVRASPAPAMSCGQVAIKLGPPFDGPHGSMNFKPLAQSPKPADFRGIITSVDGSVFLILDARGIYAVVTVPQGVATFNAEGIEQGSEVSGFGTPVGPVKIDLADGSQSTVLGIRAACIEGPSSAFFKD